MSGFAASWLDLREAADARARDPGLADRLGHWLHRSRRPEPALAITDLGGGTAANLRWLAPRLDGDQHWRIVDNDAALLDAQAARLARWAEAQAGAIVADAAPESMPAGTRLRIDLPSQSLTVDPLSLDLSAALPALDLTAADLVTASALLDLVSAEWQAAVVARIVAAGAAALFALTYDGRIRLAPTSADDALVRTLVNRHQQRDKGFGPALGPAASDGAVACFATAGYTTWRARSDWRLDGSDAALQRALLAGWIEAAGEVDAAAKPRLDRWAEARRRQIDDGGLVIVVGHEDLLALPG